MSEKKLAPGNLLSFPRPRLDGDEAGARAHDLAVVERLRDGDGDALAELYDRHAPLVLGLLTRLLGSRAEAEEVLQEAFLEAWRGAGRYDPRRASPRGWLLMLARSRALDVRRSNRSRRRREESTHLDAPRSEAPMGLERLVGRQRGRAVAGALAALPRAQRQAIEMAFFGGLTHRQIAAALDLPLGTVKSRILFGLRKLRALLERPAA